MSLEQDLQAYERITSVQNLSGYDKKPGDVYKEILEKMNGGLYSAKELFDYFAFLGGRGFDFNSQQFGCVPKVVPWTSAHYLVLDRWVPVAWAKTKGRAESIGIASGYHHPYVESADTYNRLIKKTA